MIRAAARRQTHEIAMAGFESSDMGLFSLGIDEFRPVGLGFLQISCGVLIELVQNVLAVLEVELPVDDLEGGGVDIHSLVDRDPVGAVAAELRKIFFRIRVKQVLVFLGGKVVGGSIQLGLEIGLAFDGLVVGEVGHRVVTFHGTAGPGGIKKVLGPN